MYVFIFYRLVEREKTAVTAAKVLSSMMGAEGPTEPGTGAEPGAGTEPGGSWMSPGGNRGHRIFKESHKKVSIYAIQKAIMHRVLLMEKEEGLSFQPY